MICRRLVVVRAGFPEEPFEFLDRVDRSPGRTAGMQEAPLGEAVNGDGADPEGLRRFVPTEREFGRGCAGSSWFCHAPVVAHQGHGKYRIEILDDRQLSGVPRTPAPLHFQSNLVADVAKLVVVAKADDAILHKRLEPFEQVLARLCRR